VFSTSIILIWLKGEYRFPIEFGQTGIIKIIMLKIGKFFSYSFWTMNSSQIAVIFFFFTMF